MNSNYNKINNFKKYYLYFMMYACFGWLYEVFLEVVVYHWGFTNRGVLFGPYCPVYGVGALSFIFLVYPFIKNKNLKHKFFMVPLVFLLCMFIATIIELVTSYICEFFIGSWPWQTYANYKYNFQARIALSPSLRFGLGGVFFLYVLQPIFEKFILKLENQKLNTLFIIILSIFSIDFIIFVINLII